jgi:hypothetical protein
VNAGEESQKGQTVEPENGVTAAYILTTSQGGLALLARAGYARIERVI